MKSDLRGVRGRQGRRAPTTARLVAVLLVAAGMWGCGQAPEMRLADVSIVRLGDEEPTMGTVMRVGQRMQQGATFTSGTVKLAEQYAGHLRDDGWAQAAQRQDVNMLEYQFTRDSNTATVRFLAGRGVTVEVTTPADAVAPGRTP